MEWKINIEGFVDRRIEVRYEPLLNDVVFTGVYKIKNSDWIIFSRMNVLMNDEFNLEKITSTLAIVYDLMKKRIVDYENLNEGFKHIKVIEMVDET